MVLCQVPINQLLKELGAHDTYPFCNDGNLIEDIIEGIPGLVEGCNNYTFAKNS